MNAPALPSVLLVEDDPRLADLVGRYLGSNGYRVAHVTRGDAVLAHVRARPPDLLILDLGLPGLDGLAVCRQLREIYDNPILILTARATDVDQVLGLEYGADDYVVKPVEPRVLNARLQALLRRTRRREPAAPRVLRFGELEIHVAARAVRLRGEPVGLGSTEFDLLIALAEQAGQIQSRESLFRKLYRREYDGVDRNLDIRISRLRRKLGDNADDPQRIKTIWGQGYLFVADGW